MYIYIYIHTIGKNKKKIELGMILHRRVGPLFQNAEEQKHIPPTECQAAVE
jgi:hypothetical protein